MASNFAPSVSSLGGGAACNFSGDEEGVGRGGGTTFFPLVALVFNRGMAGWCCCNFDNAGGRRRYGEVRAKTTRRG